MVAFVVIVVVAIGPIVTSIVGTIHTVLFRQLIVWNNWSVHTYTVYRIFTKIDYLVGCMNATTTKSASTFFFRSIKCVHIQTQQTHKTKIVVTCQYHLCQMNAVTTIKLKVIIILFIYWDFRVKFYKIQIRNVLENEECLRSFQY